jgi:hypothetical protein
MDCNRARSTESIEIEDKVHDICMFVKKNNKAIESIQEDLNKLLDKKKELEDLNDKLKGLLSRVQGMKFAEIDFNLSWRKSNKVTIINLDELPKKYIKTKVLKEVDKSLIKSQLMQGNTVAGACLVEVYNPQIK